MSRQSLPTGQRTIDIDALAESTANAWIFAENPPNAIAKFVERYHVLDAQIQSSDQPEPLYGEANAVFDKIKAAAITVVRVHVQVEHQLRHADRRDEARLTLSQRWAMACARLPLTQSWGTSEWYAMRRRFK